MVAYFGLMSLPGRRKHIVIHKSMKLKLHLFDFYHSPHRPMTGAFLLCHYIENNYRIDRPSFNDTSSNSTYFSLLTIHLRGGPFPRICLSNVCAVFVVFQHD